MSNISSRSPLMAPGIAPSLNRSHLLSRGARYAGVAVSGGVFLDLLRGGRSVQTGGSTTMRITGAGPSITNVASTYNAVSNSFSDGTPAALNFAVLGEYVRNDNSAFNYVFGTGTGGLGSGIQVFLSGREPALFGQFGVSYSGNVVQFGSPYFFAVSVTSTLQNWIVFSLSTGRMVAVSVSSNIGSIAPGVSTWSVGGYSGSLVSGYNSITAVAYSLGNFLSLAQLTQIAQRPFDYWFSPASRQMLVPIGAVGSTVVSGLGEADGYATTGASGAVVGGGVGEADGYAATGASSTIAVMIPASGEADGYATALGISGVIITPPQFPTILGLSFPVHRRPTFRTIMVSGQDGTEARTALWSAPLWEFEITFDSLSVDSSLPGIGVQTQQLLMGFYLEMGGSETNFLYTDPDFSSAVGQTCGTGDGTNQVFTLRRTIGSWSEPASYVTGTPTVYLNGVVQSSSSWSLVRPNTIVFNSAPGAGVVVSADFNYSFECRFLDDTEDFEQVFANLWQLRSMKFRQVRT